MIDGIFSAVSSIFGQAAAEAQFRMEQHTKLQEIFYGPPKPEEVELVEAEARRRMVESVFDRTDWRYSKRHPLDAWEEET